MGLAKYPFAIDISTNDWSHRKPNAILEANTQTSYSPTLVDEEAVSTPPAGIPSCYAMSPTHRKSSATVAEYVLSIAALAYAKALSLEEEDETPSPGLILPIPRA